MRVNLRPAMFLLAGAVGLRLASAPTATLSYLVIAAYALLGRSQALQALALSCLFSVLSPAVAPDAAGATVGRYAVLMGAALSVFLRTGIARRNIKVGSVTVATVLLGMFFVGHSLVLSPVLGVSVLKAISWTVAMCTVVSAWMGLTVLEREALIRQLMGGLALVFIASAPLVGSEAGYLTNGTGFQGILNQPQAFGAAMALLGAWAASEMFATPKPSWRMVGLAAASLMMVFLSEARTGGFALVLGVLFAMMLAPGLSGRSTASVLPGLRSRRTLLIGLLGLTTAVALSAQIQDALNHFLSKSGRAEASTVMDAFEASRGELVELMWDNIQKKPVTGIGFGIASRPEAMEIKYDPFLGLPTSAPVEKGVLPVAVLEEVGIFGALAVLAWLIPLVKRSARGGVPPVAVGLTVLLLNMGESTLFSPGGIGLFTLVLLGWTFACSQRKSAR